VDRRGLAGRAERAGRHLARPRFWLWAYIIFVVSNAMTPSEADRQPWLVAGVYLLIAIVIAWLLGGCLC